MPDAFAYHDGFDLNTVEPLHVEVLVIHGGPVTLTASTAAAVESIHLTPDQARRLGGAANARRRRRRLGARTATGYVKPEMPALKSSAHWVEAINLLREELKKRR